MRAKEMALKEATCMMNEDRGGEMLYVFLVKRQGRGNSSKRLQKRPYITHKPSSLVTHMTENTSAVCIPSGRRR
jgi:hypothetical protein